MTDRTIEPFGPDEFVVYEHGEYEESSVLAGQSCRMFLATFPTVAEAQAVYPTADVLGHSTRVQHAESDCAPEWFDSADIGEEW